MHTDEEERIEATVLRQSYPVAAKEHVCRHCGSTIRVGERYVVTVWIVDGEFWTMKSHTPDGYADCNLD